MLKLIALLLSINNPEEPILLAPESLSVSESDSPSLRALQNAGYEKKDQEHSTFDLDERSLGLFKNVGDSKDGCCTFPDENPGVEYYDDLECVLDSDCNSDSWDCEFVCAGEWYASSFLSADEDQVSGGEYSDEMMEDFEDMLTISDPTLVGDGSRLRKGKKGKKKGNKKGNKKGKDKDMNFQNWKGYKKGKKHKYGSYAPTVSRSPSGIMNRRSWKSGKKDKSWKSGKKHKYGSYAPTVSRSPSGIMNRRSWKSGKKYKSRKSGKRHKRKGKKRKKNKFGTPAPTPSQTNLSSFP